MSDEQGSDDDMVRVPVSMTRAQRRRFRTMAASKDYTGAGPYILALALPALERDEAARQQPRSAQQQGGEDEAQ